MAVRSYTPGSITIHDGHIIAPKRGVINRENTKKAATPNSKTQRRKHNKSNHMQNTRGFK